METGRGKIVRVELYVGEDDDWYAKTFTTNNKELFRSSEGYANKLDLEEICRTSWPTAHYVIDGETVSH